MNLSADQAVEALRHVAPDLLRSSGAIARRMRSFNVALPGKSSGSANTDALTLADLTVQELVTAGLRDRAPELRQCRIEAEEANGDLAAFADHGPLTIALDPIDGTRCYRDRTSDAYAVMIHLRTQSDLLYSLVYAPESGPSGVWTEACRDVVKCGPDDLSRPALECLERLPRIDPRTRRNSKKIYLIGFQKEDAAKARSVTQAGLEGVLPDDMPDNIYSLLARGEFGGSLIHTPNVYDYPVSAHLARRLGGDSVWVHNGQPVDFRQTWLDERAKMIRLPGIVATADSAEKLQILTNLARDWNPHRYPQ